MSDQSGTRWLEGIRVLDLTRFVAGPVCTRLLVELGADVIKVEQPPWGDPTRSGRPRVNKRSGMHIQQNRGKRSLCLDLRTTEGQQIVRDLVPHMDIVVENFSPGVMAHRNIGYDDLRELKSDLIMVSVSGFGQSGPWSERPTFDLIAQAATGFMHMTGEADGPPTFVGSAIADSNAGVHAWGAVGHALFHRERTGNGMHLDVAMADALFHMHDSAITSASRPDGRAPEPIRQGRFFNSLAPAGGFLGPDGWIVILCTEDQMPALWGAIGRPELQTDPRFAGNPDRIENREELTAIIEEWMASVGSNAAVLEAFEAARVPHAEVASLEDALSNPHFLERGTVRTVTDPRLGEIQIAGFPVLSSEPLPPDDHVAAALGEHNAEVLTDLLGMSSDQIDDLADRGVIADRPH